MGVAALLGQTNPAWAADPTPAPTPKPTEGPNDTTIKSSARDDYYLFPLNFETSKPLDYNMVVDQGYQVHCAGSGLDILKGKEGSIEELFKYTGGVGGETSSFEKILLEEAKYPMFRDATAGESTDKTSSLEGYFSARNQTFDGDNEAQSANSSGVVSGLYTTEAQCVLKVKNLYLTKHLCSLLDEPSKCALDKEIVGVVNPETGKNFKQTEFLRFLQDKLHISENPNESGEGVITCSDFYSKAQEVEDDLGVETYSLIKGGFNKLTINLDKAFRQAYFVLAVSLQNKPNPTATFWFRDSSGSGGYNPDETESRHVPLIVNVKIPTTGTNYIQSLENYQDPIMLSTRFTKSEKDLQEYSEQVKKDREGFLASVHAAAEKRDSDYKGDLVLDCRGLAACGTKKVEGGPDPAFRDLLIDMINAHDDECQDVNKDQIDPVKGLGSEAANGDKITKFKEDSNGQSAYTSKISSANAQNQFTWRVEIRSNDNPFSSTDNIDVRAFFIAPVGADLDQANKLLRWMFAEELQNTMSEKDKEPDYFNIVGGQIGFNSEQSFKYLNPNNIDPDDKDCTEANKCYTDTVDFYLQDNSGDNGLATPGGNFGWLLRKIQEGLRKSDQQDWQSIEACESTEDMFMGRCKASTNGGSSNNN